jgi:hypothetical protein
MRMDDKSLATVIGVSSYNVITAWSLATVIGVSNTLLFTWRDSSVIRLMISSLLFSESVAERL